MTKCPYCETSFHLTDFFEKEEGVFRDKYTFKGQQIYEKTASGGRCRMWTCPNCDTLLGITDSNWAR